MSVRRLVLSLFLALALLIPTSLVLGEALVESLLPTRPGRRYELTYTLRGPGAGTVIDGPFAETKEQLLGFYVVDCADEDAAKRVIPELLTARGLPLRRLERIEPSLEDAFVAIIETHVASNEGHVAANPPKASAT